MRRKIIAVGKVEGGKMQKEDTANRECCQRLIECLFKSSFNFRDTPVIVLTKKRLLNMIVLVLTIMSAIMIVIILITYNADDA